MDVHCAGCLFITSINVVQGVFLPPAVRTRRMSLHPKQYGRAGCMPFKFRTVFVNAVMPDCLASCQSGIDMKKNQSSTRIRGPSPALECPSARAGHKVHWSVEVRWSVTQRFNTYFSIEKTDLNGSTLNIEENNAFSASIFIFLSPR